MGPAPKTKTIQLRRWKGINQTDARVAIDPDELFWNENAITIGNGAIQVLRNTGPIIATIAAGIDTLWGFTLHSLPVLMTVNQDGSMDQISVPSGTITPVAPPGTFSAGHATHLSIWQGSPIVIIDPVAGYFWWDGTALGGNVMDGVFVHSSSPPAMTVDVDAGNVNFWGTPTAVAAQPNLPIAAADPTLPRIDLVTIDNTGTAVITTGVPALNPVPPAPPTSGGFQNIIVAQVFVGAGVTTIIAPTPTFNPITDLRALTTLTGDSIAVFEGRVWISKGRVITFSAPNSYTDFSTANGGGFAQITDEAFQGDIVALVSALEELWIVGHSAIDALANVTAVGTPPNVATSFSITNILTNVGTNAPHSVIGYFRALALLAPFGIYALSGVTPQKLSDKLDGLFPDLVLDDRISAAVAVIENLLCLLFLATYTGTQAQAGPPPVQLIIGFKQGQMFLAVQGPTTWITTLVVNGVAQAWGTDGHAVYQLFGASADVPIVYKVQGKLDDMGAATTEKALMKVGFEFQASFPINPRVTMDSENTSVPVPLTASNQITAIINNAGVAMTLLNDSGDPLTILSQGLILAKEQTALFGHYIGWTITGADPPYRLQAIEEEFALTREWDTSP